MVQKEQTKPRGRPRQFDRTTALYAMREAFWNKGYAATSLDDLCAAAGLNRPSLYNAFGDKAQVFLAVLESYVAEVRPRYEAAFRAPGPLRQVIKGIFRTAAEIYRVMDRDGGRGCLMIGAALTDATRDPQVGAAILTQLQDMEKGFCWLLSKAKAEGQLPAHADPKTLAKLASSVHTALSVRMRAGEPPENLRGYVEAMIDIICPPTAGI